MRTTEFAGNSGFQSGLNDRLQQLTKYAQFWGWKIPEICFFLDFMRDLVIYCLTGRPRERVEVWEEITKNQNEPKKSEWAKKNQNEPKKNLLKYPECLIFKVGVLHFSTSFWTWSHKKIWRYATFSLAYFRMWFDLNLSLCFKFRTSHLHHNCIPPLSDVAPCNTRRNFIRRILYAYRQLFELLPFSNDLPKLFSIHSITESCLLLIKWLS